MKKIFISFISLSQFSYAFQLSNLSLNFLSDSAPKLCAKRAKVDQPQCHEFIKDKIFRKEFLSVCFEVHKKMGPENSMNCLETIADKSPTLASQKQAEICENLVASNSVAWVFKCLNSNLINDFANICARYLENKNEKSNESAVKCIHGLDGITEQDLDMTYFRTKCAMIKNNKDFSAISPCLSHAESEKSGFTGEQTRIEKRLSEENKP